MNEAAPTPPTWREQAVILLDEIRALIEAANLDNGAQKAATLQQILQEWHAARQTDISAARAWLEAGLQEDTLLFDIETANYHLLRWAAATLDEDADLLRIKKRVAEKTAEKHTNLQVRGVVAHCDELWAEAARLEGDTPPAPPEFLLNNFYSKAQRIAAAALAEHSGNTDLTMLLQKAERAATNKALAAHVYSRALLAQQYREALEDLAKLPEDTLIPRYTLVTSESGQATLNLDSMLAIDAAHTEIDELARQWAANHAQTTIKAATEQLKTHQPQAALDSLGARPPGGDAFLKAELLQQLTQLSEVAHDDRDHLEQAEKRAQEALKLVEDSPLSAWDVYREALALYEVSPVLEEARESILSALRARLEQLVAQTDAAFENRQMEEVQQLSQQALHDFSEKDVAFNQLLEHLHDLDSQARGYKEYMQSAIAALKQIQEGYEQDGQAASEALVRLRAEFPDIIIGDLPGLAEAEATVHSWLEAEALYHELYNVLFVETESEVEDAIAAAHTASENHGEHYFQQLQAALELHLSYLKAQAQEAAGEHQAALELARAVAAVPDHPDAEAAQTLAETLTKTLAGQTEQADEPSAKNDD